MAKYETPPPVRPLEKLITDFSYTNGLDPVNVFNDFLTYIIHGFSPGAPPLQSWKYKRQQNMKFMQMLTGWVRLMANRIKDDTSWYDPFGDLYMALVSKSAQQSQGQFFTPVHICDLMVLCTQTEEKKTGQRMGDPTCGSGRLLLAYHVRHLGNYLVAEDVKFTLEDTMEVQKVEMKDARTPETPSVPQTGDDHWKPILLFALLGVSAAGLMATMLYKKRHKKADEAKKEE